jgi:alkanesulfonate monooxygenase SsuD/methylene tetrahydromethanopterin reductase-like flavin-dependent oxidoreductase (luciferase family)
MTGPSEVPIWIGALGPQTIELTAQLADGWLPTCATVDHLTSVRDELESIRHDAGVCPNPLEIITGPTVSIGNADSAPAMLAFYLCTMGDGYANFVAAQGYANEIDTLRAANPKPTPSDCQFPEESAVLLDQLMVSGTPAEVREGLEHWDALTDTLLVGVPPGESWEAAEQRLQVCGPT